MPPQVSKMDFELALREIGHNPDDYRGKRLSLAGICGLYDLDESIVIEAIRFKHIAAHYDYGEDTQGFRMSESAWSISKFSFP